MIVALVVLVVVMALAMCWYAVCERRLAAEWAREQLRRLEERDKTFEGARLEFNRVVRREDERLNKAQEIILGHYVAAVEKMTAYGRYELDAGERALKMQKIIDDRVRDRTLAVKVGSDGRVLLDRNAAPPEAGEQPPDPNVRTVAYIDEVHELEREASRFTNSDIDYNVRDATYQEQPAMMEP